MQPALWRAAEPAGLVLPSLHSRGASQPALVCTRA